MDLADGGRWDRVLRSGLEDEVDDVEKADAVAELCECVFGIRALEDRRGERGAIEEKGREGLSEVESQRRQRLTGSAQ